MRPPCRSHALGASSPLSSSAFASPYVDTLDDAVFVVDASVGGVGSFGAVALLLDDDDRLLTSVECPGCDSPDRVVELCSTRVAAATPLGAWRRLVLASSFDAPPAAWSAVVDAVRASPVELVDWLVLDLPTGVVRSLCETAEGRFPW